MSDPAFYSAEQPIIDRLKAKLLAGSPVPKIVIGSTAFIGGSAEFATLLPAILVQPGDTTPTDEDTDDGSGAEEEVWEVVLCVKALSDMTSREATFAGRQGGLLDQIKDALLGFQPITGRGAKLRYAGRPKPIKSIDGPWIEYQMNFKLSGLVAGASS